MNCGFVTLLLCLAMLALTHRATLAADCEDFCENAKDTCEERAKNVKPYAKTFAKGVCTDTYRACMSKCKQSREITADLLRLYREMKEEQTEEKREEKFNIFDILSDLDAQYIDK